jgi:hypothetical protein
MTNLAESSKESYGSERSVLPTMMTMTFINVLIYAVIMFAMI